MQRPTHVYIEDKSKRNRGTVCSASWKNLEDPIWIFYNLYCWHTNAKFFFFFMRPVSCKGGQTMVDSVRVGDFSSQIFSKICKASK